MKSLTLARVTASSRAFTSSSFSDCHAIATPEGGSVVTGETLLKASFSAKSLSRSSVREA